MVAYDDAGGLAAALVHHVVPERPEEADPLWALGELLASPTLPASGQGESDPSQGRKPRGDTTWTGPKGRLIVSTWLVSPLIYPETKLVRVCSNSEYMDRKRVLRGRFC